MKNLIIITLAVLCFAFHVKSQERTNGHFDDLPAPRAPIREADIMWLNTVWQRIDLREKFNQGFYFPQKTGAQNRYSFFDYLKNALLSDPSFRAFNPGVLGDDDMFRVAFTKNEIDSLFYEERTLVTQNVFNPDKMDTITQRIELSGEHIIAYEIKEQWYFDKQRSVMDVKIIGICPMIRVYDENTGEYKGEKPLFWIYMPEAVSAMAGWEYFNAHNQSDQLSYDDVFLKRKFHSYIVKTSNVYDRYILEYASGKDALIEAEKEKMKIFNMEHDFWSF